MEILFQVQFVYVHLELGSQRYLPVLLTPATLSTIFEWESWQIIRIYKNVFLLLTWTIMLITLEKDGMREKDLNASIFSRFGILSAITGSWLTR